MYCVYANIYVNYINWLPVKGNPCENQKHQNHIEFVMLTYGPAPVHQPDSATRHEMCGRDAHFPASAKPEVSPCNKTSSCEALVMMKPLEP